VGSFWNPFGVGVGAVLTWLSLQADLPGWAKYTVLGVGLLFIAAAVVNSIRERSSNTHEGVTMNKRNTIDVTGDNNSVQVGHLGDVNINQAPEPDLKIVSNSDQTNPDGTHTKVIRLQVVAPYPPGGCKSKQRRRASWTATFIPWTLGSSSSALQGIGPTSITYRSPTRSAAMTLSSRPRPRRP
jgi:hypothetical protein